MRFESCCHAVHVAIFFHHGLRAAIPLTAFDMSSLIFHLLFLGLQVKSEATPNLSQGFLNTGKLMCSVWPDSWGLWAYIAIKPNRLVAFARNNIPFHSDSILQCISLFSKLLLISLLASFPGLHNALGRDHILTLIHESKSEPFHISQSTPTCNICDRDIPWDFPLGKTPDFSSLHFQKVPSTDLPWFPFALKFESKNQEWKGFYSV